MRVLLLSNLPRTGDEGEHEKGTMGSRHEAEAGHIPAATIIEEGIGS